MAFPGYPTVIPDFTYIENVLIIFQVFQDGNMFVHLRYAQTNAFQFPECVDFPKF